MRRLVATVLALLFATSCGPAERSIALHAADEIPQQLSDWNIVFARNGVLELNDGVVPYELNTPLFSDYALKLRTLWLPEGSYATYRERGEFDFPVGTIITKTFHYKKAAEWTVMSPSVLARDRRASLNDNGQLALEDHVLIETRLLVRYEDGWKALPYVWNTEQNEAYLEIAGDIRSLELVSERGSEEIAYVVPDGNQCSGCHTPNHTSKELRPLGPRAWQLNGEYRYVDGVANQITRWQAFGMLRGVGATLPQGVNWYGPGDASLEQRARAYLDANCAHCHNPAGAADTSALHLNIDAPVDRRFGICKAPVAVGRGSGDRPYDIYPGRPDDSILLYRMQHADPAIAMPELGRSAIHDEAVALIRDWIAGMAGDC
ncbi:MAG: hypothetical protein KJO95_09335 [Gammaproteobacteria bacterium]|nr:hypothetical protein [Woeseia sp.]MBT8103158.1 hypothetical protein [Gammaproteobacteria bacterium]